MSSDYDATEFVDGDFQSGSKPGYSPAGTGGTPGAPLTGARAPSREEVDSRVSETQQKLMELKRAQEELERERAGLEETRRRQMEFQSGRQETIQNLTRGIGLLTAAEFASRRDAEQMAKALADMQMALSHVEATNDQNWTKENFTAELTRSLTVIENARMEWNGALVKFPVLSGEGRGPVQPSTLTPNANSPFSGMSGQSLGELCKLGLALTWPLAVAVIFVGCLLVFCLKR